MQQTQTDHSMHIKKMNRQVGAAINNTAVFKSIVAVCKESAFKENQMCQTIQSTI